MTNIIHKRLHHVLFLFTCIIFTYTLFLSTDVLAAKVTYNKTTYVGQTFDMRYYADEWLEWPMELPDKGVTFQSSDKAIATVTKSGIVKGIKKGTVKITASYNETVWSYKKARDVKEKQEIVFKVKVLPYEGQTDQKYLDYDINGKTITITGISNTLSTVTIPREIDGLKVTKIGRDAFSYSKKLKNLTLLDNIQTIDDSAFYDCSNLTTVKLCATVKSIGDEAFFGCVKLNSINIPKSVKKIGVNSFYDCSKLKNIELKNVVSIAYGAFSYCTSLKSITLSDQMKKVSEFAFEQCYNLTSVTLGKEITEIGTSSFSECKKLKSIDLQSVKTIGAGAFGSCKALNKVNFFDKLKTIGESAFYECISLSSIALPDSLSNIGDYAFNQCDSLKEIITTNNQKCTLIGEYIFANTSFDSTAYAYKNNVTFHFTKEERDYINKLQDYIKQMNISDSDSDLDKIQKVHDWLVINVSYSLKQHNIYAELDMSDLDIVLDKRFAICNSYSNVFKEFMDMLDVECIKVISWPMNHAWNMVKLDDGCWYHIDVTWDDPGYDDEVWLKGWLRYSNLLRDDDGITSTGHHSWDSDAPKANGTKYQNYFDISYQIQF